MKKYIKYLMFFLGVFMMSSCAYYARYIYLNFPDVNDYKHLPGKSIHHDTGAKSYPYSASTDFQIEKLMPVRVADKEITDLNNFLMETKTTSFIIIRNDTVLFEQYNYGHSRITPVKTFSVSKKYRFVADRDCHF